MSNKQKALYGLIGYPVKHSLSPAMHNAAFQACGINAEYKLFAVKPEDLEDFFLNPPQDLKGFNVTIPHKVRAKEILDGQTVCGTKPVVGDEHSVRVSGAINTVKRCPEGLYYTNTDAQAFLRSLKEDLDFLPQRSTVLLLGCGGAARAVIAGLTAKPEQVRKIYISELSETVRYSASRHFSALGETAGIYEFIAQGAVRKVISDCDLLVNATPVGMRRPDPPVIEAALLHKELVVYDVIYNRKTPLIFEAEKRCRAAAGGLGMLFYQAVAAWELWMEREAPLAAMRQALQQAAAEINA